MTQHCKGRLRSMERLFAALRSHPETESLAQGGKSTGVNWEHV